MVSTSAVGRGGEWLFQQTEATSASTPENLPEEHRLLADTVGKFFVKEVLKESEELERKNWKRARQLLQRGGELGLLGIHAAEEYGGLNLDTMASLVLSERIARCPSFGITLSVHTNLCVLPISLFGTPDQKRKYLPRLVSGEMVGAYALSEAESGSDALNARTRATKTADGTWVLNGEKMWISNGGFADVMTIFAKVDGQLFTAFLVERAFSGVSSGKEEQKMGLNGSSTTPIILQDARVPAENVLGEIGKGHKVALITLNFGRLAIGAMSVGTCKEVIGEAARYAAERKQFDRPIANFGAIKHKLGEMTARTYAVESLVYRTGGLIDAAIAATPRVPDDERAGVARAGEEFALEASIAKIAGSETLHYVTDENVQIHGGNGFVKDYAAEGHVRDARAHRIFEGTNEVNRMVIASMLIRRTLKGSEPLLVLSRGVPDGGVLKDESIAVASLKNTALMVLGSAMRTYGPKVLDEQEVLMHIADIVIDTFAAESALLRALAATASGDGQATLHQDAVRVFVDAAGQRVQAAARNALIGMSEGDTLATALTGLRQLATGTPVNTMMLRRRLAEATTSRGAYLFNG